MHRLARCVSFTNTSSRINFISRKFRNAVKKRTRVQARFDTRAKLFTLYIFHNSTRLHSSMSVNSVETGNVNRFALSHNP